MTLALDDRKVTYSPVSSTDTFAVDFPIFGTDDLRVWVDDVETTAFSVNATFVNGRAEDAEIVLDTPVSAVDVLIHGDTPAVRDEDFSGGSPNLVRLAQNDLDRIYAKLQELGRDFSSTPVNTVPDGVLVSAFAETILDDGDAAAVLATLGATATGVSVLQAANVAAIRTLLSLGSLALLSSISLSNIASGDRPDDNDLSNGGTKLALRKNAKAYTDAQIAALTLNGGYEYVGITTLASDGTTVTYTGLDEYTHVKATLVGNIALGNQTVTFQARAAAGTWRSLATFNGSTGAADGVLAVFEIQNFNNDNGNDIKIIDGQGGSSSTVLDRTDAENAINGSGRLTASFRTAEVWDEVRFLCSGDFEGSSASEATSIIIEAY